MAAPNTCCVLMRALEHAEPCVTAHIDAGKTTFIRTHYCFTRTNEPSGRGARRPRDDGLRSAKNERAHHRSPLRRPSALGRRPA